MNSTQLWLLSGLALILTACPSTTAPTPAGQPITSVSGTVVLNTSTDANLTTAPWKKGAGTVTGQIYIQNATATDNPVVATGSLAADGSFTLPLPATVEASKLLSFNNDSFQPYGIYNSYSQGMAKCTGTPTFSTLSAHSTSLTLDVASDGTHGEIRSSTGSGTTTTDTTTGTMHNMTNFKEGALVYMDAPVTLKGTVTCSGPIVAADATAPLGTIHGTTTVNLNLAKGWNKVTLAAALDGTTTQTSTSFSTDITLNLTVTSGTLPNDKWVLTGLPMGMAKLHKSPSYFFH